MDPSQSLALNRLLAHLSKSLSVESSSLPQSQYERNKVGSNIEHARTLLLTLEKQASTIRVQNERQRVQADLLEKREVVKQLGGRLEELNKLGDKEDDDDDDEADDEESGADDESDGQRQSSYAPARSDAQDGLETGGDTRDGPGIQLPETIHNELRSRSKALQASDNRDAASTTARETLFANRSPQPKSDPNLSQTETLLSHNRTEQDTLTNGLLGLARALKESSLQFSSSLEGEKDVLKRAEGGLDKNAQGMETAERKMGTLRKMSEGQGWWGRIKLYAMIFGLWVAAFLLVFVGPKIRL